VSPRQTVHPVVAEDVAALPPLSDAQVARVAELLRLVAPRDRRRVVAA